MLNSSFSKRGRQFCLPLLIFSLHLGFTSVQELSSQDYYDAGLRFARENQFITAERFYKKAIELEPNNPHYRFELANNYAQQVDEKRKRNKYADMKKEMEFARRELQAATMIKPNFLAAHYNLGVVLKKLGEFEMAREQFRKVLEMAPDQYNAYMQIGATYEAQGFFEEAREAYEKVQELHYHHPGLHGALEDLETNRQAYREWQRTQEAQSRFGRNRPFRYSPGSAPAQYQNQRNEQLSQGRSGYQALPFLGSWLVQEFMKMRAQK